MYTNVSDEFESLIKDAGRTFYAKLINGTDVIDDIRSIHLYQASNGSDNIGIGGCVSSYIDCKIGTTNLPLEGVEYELYIGLQLLDREVEYVPVGCFTPTKPVIQNEITTFIAYNRVKLLSDAYFSDIENYPVDSKIILSEISQKTGCPIDYSNLADGTMVDKRAVMTDVTVDEEGAEIQTTTYEKPFTGYTYQEAVCYIAQLHGKFAQADRNGNISFKWFESTEYQISQNQYFDNMGMAEKDFVLGVIKCSTASDEFTSGSGAIGISIDNPVMTQALLDNVYNTIGGFKCKALTLNFNGDIRLDVGDIVKVQTNAGEISVPIMKMETVYDGGIHQVIHVFGETGTVEQKKGPTAERLDRMYNELLLVKEVMANKISTDTLKARIAEMGYASIDELSAEVAKMGLMTAEEADIKYMTAESAAMKYATIDSLNALQGNFNSLNAKAITTDNLTTEVAKIGYLTATEAELKYLTAETANLKYANIDLSNIQNGTITTAMIATGAISTAQIADGSITDAKIVGLTANKITAGTLDAATIEVVNLNAANITVGTINGQQIASNTVSLDNLASDVTGKLADTEEDVAKAVADAKQAILDSASAALDASNAVSTVEDLEERANSGEFKGDKGDTGATGPQGPTGAKGDKGDTGATGKGVSKVDVQYYLSTSSTSQTGGSWQTTVPTWKNGYYMWTKTVTTYTDSTTSTTTPVCITGAKGATGATGATGSAGATGATGKGVSAIVEQYYLSTSNTAQSGGSWSTTCPTWSSGKYIWTRSKITWTDSTTTYTTATLANAINSANSTAASANSTASTANTNASTALSTANTAKSTADAAQKSVYASFNGNGSSKGYFKVATLKIIGTYINTDVVIGAVSRGYGYSTVQIMFGSTNSTDPALSYFKQNGSGAWYIHKSSTSTWDIYCKKNEAYGGCTIVDYVAKSGITLTWNASDANADLPSGATRATQMAGQATWCYDNNLSYLNGGVIYAGTVVANAIAAGAIVADKIASSAVTAVKIAAGAITTDKLAANAVTAAKIAAGTITATQIAASTITGAKIAAGTISATNIATGAITTDKLVAGAVTGAKIAADTITASNIAANAITASEIAAGAVSTSELAANAVTAAKIAASTITADKLNVTSLSAISANLGTVTAGVIQSTNYVANSAGMKLNLATGVWDSKYFKLSNTGAITATSGTLGCFSLTTTGLSNSVLKILSNGSNTAQLSVYKPSVTDPIFDVGMSSSWNYFSVTSMNEIVLAADDIYLSGNVWVKDDISTEDGISLRGLNNNLAEKGNLVSLATCLSTTFQSFSIGKEYRYYFFTVMTTSGRPLVTTLIDNSQARRCTGTGSTAEACYGQEPSNYHASLYFSADLKTAYIKTISSFDAGVLYGII